MQFFDVLSQGDLSRSPFLLCKLEQFARHKKEHTCKADCPKILKNKCFLQMFTLTLNQRVVGSNPTGGIFRPCFRRLQERRVKSLRNNGFCSSEILLGGTICYLWAAESYTYFVRLESGEKRDPVWEGDEVCAAAVSPSVRVVRRPPSSYYHFGQNG